MYNWTDSEPPGAYAHEAGHLMGLIDQYTDYDGINGICYDEDDPCIALPGHEEDIMGSLSGKPTQKSIDDIVARGGVICPCECCPKPITGDASIEFDTWTINGQPVPPGAYEVPRSTIIDIRYKVHVDGQPGAVVTVQETSWLNIHYVSGEEPSILLHAVNAPGAVSMDPPATKRHQMTVVEGEPAPYCTYTPLLKCVPVNLGVGTEWTPVVCTDYTKTINWLHIGQVTDEEVLFDLQALPGQSYTLYSLSQVALEGDENPENDDTDWSPALNIAVIEE